MADSVRRTGLETLASTQQHVVDGEPAHSGDSLNRQAVNPFGSDTLNAHQRREKPLGSQVVTPQDWLVGAQAMASQPAQAVAAIPTVAQVELSEETTASTLDRIRAWWSGQGAEGEGVARAESEPVPVEPVEEVTQEPAQASYYEGLTAWARSVWGCLHGLFFGETPVAAASEPESAQVFARLTPEDRAELNRFLHIISKIMARAHETLTEAELERLMESILMVAHYSKTEEFQLRKSQLMRQHDFLKKLQLERLNDLDEYIEHLRRNRFWSRCEELTASLGLMTGLAAGGASVVAAFLGVGMIASAYANDPVERVLSRAVAWTRVGELFGANKRDTQQTAYHLIKLGIGVTTVVVSYQWGMGPMHLATTIQAIVAVNRGYVQWKSDNKQGDLEYQGSKMKGVQGKIGKSHDALLLTIEQRTAVWQAAARFANSTHEAKRMNH